MDKVEETVTNAVKKIAAEFEAKPIATTIKGVIILYVLKYAIRWFGGTQ